MIAVLTMDTVVVMRERGWPVRCDPASRAAEKAAHTVLACLLHDHLTNEQFRLPKA